MQFHGKGLFLILCACAIPLYAVDGVVLINQNAALAGNVTPGDTPGFPVVITVPGSYRLSGNLTVPDADTVGIEINAENVTIDLNGFSINGPTVCSGFPVTSCSPLGFGRGILSTKANTTVMNGKINGMGSAGIQITGRIERVDVSNNGNSGIFGAALVISCTAFSNFPDGINTNGSVINSLAFGNQRNGITLFNGVGTNNQANLNGRDGIAGSRTTLTGNTAIGNGGIGIDAICPSAVVSNTATGNTGGDIFTAGSGCNRANNAPAP